MENIPKFISQCQNTENINKHNAEYAQNKFWRKETLYVLDK